MDGAACAAPGFDLSALARHREALAHFFERVLVAVADTEPSDDLPSRVSVSRPTRSALSKLRLMTASAGDTTSAILDEVAQMRIFLLANRRFERDRPCAILRTLP